MQTKKEDNMDWEDFTDGFRFSPHDPDVLDPADALLLGAEAKMLESLARGREKSKPEDRSN
jgi:hypothetical protein